MTKMHPKQRQQPRQILKWSKYHWNLKNNQNTLKNSDKDQITTKLSQNAFDFLDIGGILVGLKLLFSF